MIVPVKFAELHSPLFHAGKNHGIKLFSRDGLLVQYDRVEKELIVQWQGKESRLPSTSVHSYEVLTNPVEPIPNQHRTESVEKRKDAQVSTPMSHVFQGEGAGKKRDK